MKQIQRRDSMLKALLKGSVSILWLVGLGLNLETVAWAADGDLDPSLGVGGMTTTDFASGCDDGRGVVMQTDGKIVVAGSAYNGTNSDFAVARYNSHGTLDATFGLGGKVTTDFFGDNDYGQGVAMQTDGKIVVTGSTYTGTNSDFAVARYNPNGTLDVTFGTGGKVTTDFFGDDDEGYAMVLQADGKIVVAGSAHVGTNDESAVARYNPNGNLDATFGTGGKVTTDFSSKWTDVTRQTDGKIVVVGDYGLAVARYTSSGILDTSFGTGGTVTTHLYGGYGATSGTALAIQTDGKIVVTGYYNIHMTSMLTIARYTSNGTLDTSFGTGGIVTTSFDSGEAVAIQTNGKIVVAGYGGTLSSNDIAVARLTPTGTLDTSFGTSGTVLTDFASGHDYGNAVVMQTDGKIVVAGSAHTGASCDVAIVRYLNSDSPGNSYLLWTK